MSRELRIRRWIVRAPATAQGRAAATRFARIARNDLRYALDDALAATARTPAADAPALESVRLAWHRPRAGDRAVARAAARLLAPRLAAAGATAGTGRSATPGDGSADAGDGAAEIATLLEPAGVVDAGAIAARVRADPALERAVRMLAGRRLDAFAPLVAVAADLLRPRPAAAARAQPWPEICAELARPAFSGPNELARTLAALVAGAAARGWRPQSAAARARTLARATWLDQGTFERAFDRLRAAAPVPPRPDGKGDALHHGRSNSGELAAGVTAPDAAARRSEPGRAGHDPVGGDQRHPPARGDHRSEGEATTAPPSGRELPSDAAGPGTDTPGVDADGDVERAPIEPAEGEDPRRAGAPASAKGEARAASAPEGSAQMRTRADPRGPAPMPSRVDRAGPDDGPSTAEAWAEAAPTAGETRSSNPPPDDHARFAFRPVADVRVPRVDPSGPRQAGAAAAPDEPAGGRSIEEAPANAAESSPERGPPAAPAERLSPQRSDPAGPRSAPNDGVQGADGRASEAPDPPAVATAPAAPAAPATPGGQQAGARSGEVDAGGTADGDPARAETAANADAVPERATPTEASGPAIAPCVPGGSAAADSDTPRPPAAPAVPPGSGASAVGPGPPASDDQARATAEDAATSDDAPARRWAPAAGGAAGADDLAAGRGDAVSPVEIALARAELADARADRALPADRPRPSARIRLTGAGAAATAGWRPTPLAGVALAVRPLADLQPGRWLAAAPLSPGTAGLATADLVALVLLDVARDRLDPASLDAPLDPFVADLAGCAPHVRPSDLAAAWAGEAAPRRAAVVGAASALAHGLARGGPMAPALASSVGATDAPQAQRDLLAAIVLARFASAIAGFEASSASYIRRSFLDREGAFARLPGELVVAMAPRPLDLVLRRAGQFEPLAHRPWRANEVLKLRHLDHGAGRR